MQIGTSSDTAKSLLRWYKKNKSSTHTELENIQVPTGVEKDFTEYLGHLARTPQVSCFDTKGPSRSAQ